MRCYECVDSDEYIFVRIVCVELIWTITQSCKQSNLTCAELTCWLRPPQLPRHHKPYLFLLSFYFVVFYVVYLMLFFVLLARPCSLVYSAIYPIQVFLICSILLCSYLSYCSILLHFWSCIFTYYQALSYIQFPGFYSSLLNPVVCQTKFVIQSIIPSSYLLLQFSVSL